jgi:hypothetical protein
MPGESNRYPADQTSAEHPREDNHDPYDQTQAEHPGKIEVELVSYKPHVVTQKKLQTGNKTWHHKMQNSELIARKIL